MDKIIEINFYIKFVMLLENLFKQMKKIKSGRYLQSPNIATIEIQKCTPLRCIILCIHVYACNGFNMKRIPFQNTCSCEIKGPESWLSFQTIEAEGSEFWMDTVFPKFFDFQFLQDHPVN